MSQLTKVCAGKKFSVWMTPKVLKAFKKLNSDARARLRKWMEFYADDGQEFLDSTKFIHEGRFKTGAPDGGDVPIYAFKAWQVRLYGTIVDGTHFVITEIDPAKKQNKANKTKLESAATNIAAVKDGWSK